MALPALRTYQRQALAAVTAGLTDGGRGQLLSACGTGKTLMAVHAAAQLVADGLVVIACPSLGLIAQTLAVWARFRAAGELLAVCSDATVRDAAVRDTAQLDCAVTTNADDVAAFVRQATAGRRLIVTTHVSAHIVGAALAAAGVACDLLVVDEAHETTGRADTDVAVLHEQDRFPARRRLYLTATPRVMQTGARGAVDDAATLSMDDETVFGPVLFRYSTARAIADGWLDDYRVVAIGVTNAEVLAALRRPSADVVHGDADATTRTVVTQLALAKAAAEFGLRRVLMFANRVADSLEFARTFAGTVAAVAAAGGDLPPGPLTTGHVDGEQSIAQRRVHLEHLIEPPGGGWTMVSNVRCLSTGVDVPAVDGVGFHGRRRASIEVIQAVGRGLRRSLGGSGMATIMLPVLLPDDPDDVLNNGDLGEWETLCQVLLALRAHDDVLGGELDRSRQSACTRRAELPVQVVLRLPDGYATQQLVEHISVRILQGTTSDWLVGYTALQAFHDSNGHVRVPVGHREHGVRLDRWIGSQREQAQAGRLLVDRRARLTALGLDLDPFGTAWQRGLAAATAFHAEHGHLRAPAGHRRGGLDLHRWLATQRRERHRARLLPERAAALEALGIVWEAKATWDDGFAAVAAFHAEHGHLNIPHGTVVNGVDVYHWLVSRRVDLREGRLTGDTRTQLDAMGMVWDLRQQQWWDQFAALRAFHAQYGHLRACTGARHDGVVLSRFMLKIRRDREEGRLTAEQIAAADAVGISWQFKNRRDQPGRPRRTAPGPRSGAASTPSGQTP
ncbi:Helicase associated domain protein [Dactylosporangium cerinum]|uniref:Helicase associated domain protein n=1 Tax=Dactylosporangium cerinum TaxID=1434730 RepID=A0ABV9WCX4_9ACTN